MTDPAPLGEAPRLRQLIEAVNRARYRGVDGNGPMRERYTWPMMGETAEDIVNAALAFVVAHEKSVAEGAARRAVPPTCSTCKHLTPFELAPDLNTCPVVNIRIHADSAAVFGCNQWEKRP